MNIHWPLKFVINISFNLLASTGDIYYTLRDVIFFLENSDASIADYRRRAFEAKATAIIEQDRVSLKDYLAGTIDICPQLDLAAAAAFVNVPTDRGKRDHAASSSTNESGQRPSSRYFHSTCH